ncbi:hypothetical protein V502_05365 [Pseudogymnoascus sp. VKM F-4520 (FW-2644)]|nr:hypothetical protein V502_05365 [Pseudogymnoascus sp. VKM F-4520 (FW-2644)]
MMVSTHLRSDQSLTVRPSSSVTNNADVSDDSDVPELVLPGLVELGLKSTAILPSDTTPEHERTDLSDGFRKSVCSPIAPSLQPSPTGAICGRTPLPNARPAPLKDSTSSPDVPLSGLDFLAMAASTRNPSPKRSTRAGRSPARAKGGLRMYVEQILTQQGRPMTAVDTHDAVVALTGQKYKYQSVRKALCEKKAPFEPHRHSTWALKSWGLSPGSIPRRFGTGGGTMEARQRRVRST